MKKGKIFIGTSGWSYKHWKGNFYPAQIKDKEEFNFYKKKFKSVEINNSFYHLPLETTFQHWYDDSPANYLFSVKASRYITHMKKLKTDEDSLEIFFERAKILKEKLGPVLFQLPPGWKLNLERLESFLQALPSGYRYTFELRNHTWHTPEVYSLLAQYKCAFCIYELEHFITPLEVTTNFIYIRLHGPEAKYQGYYSKPALKKWASRCSLWLSQGKDVYVYFDNDQLGYAAFNALTLQELVNSNKDSKINKNKIDVHR